MTNIYQDDTSISHLSRPPVTSPQRVEQTAQLTTPVQTSMHQQKDQVSSGNSAQTQAPSVQRSEVLVSYHSDALNKELKVSSGEFERITIMMLRRMKMEIEMAKEDEEFGAVLSEAWKIRIDEKEHWIGFFEQRLKHVSDGGGSKVNGQP